MFYSSNQLFTKNSFKMRIFPWPTAKKKLTELKYEVNSGFIIKILWKFSSFVSVKFDFWAFFGDFAIKAFRKKLKKLGNSSFFSKQAHFWFKNFSGKSIVKFWRNLFTRKPKNSDFFIAKQADVRASLEKAFFIKASFVTFWRKISPRKF